jgi:hypothetical protein
MELDGYDQAKELAIEFSGPQHTSWSPSKESYLDYFTRIVRDVAKVRLCQRHNVKLIVLDVSMPRHHWHGYLKSRLSDLGLAEQPYPYINIQNSTPFRNEQLESELGLSAEMAAAQAI